MARKPALVSFLLPGAADTRRALFALFCAGFITFALLYSIQPLLPQLAKHFAVSAAKSSLAISVTTFSMAFGLLIFAAISEVLGRKIIMSCSILLACMFSMLSVFMNDWSSLLWLRLALGLSLSGLPAVAMAYVSEEFSPKYVSVAMGLYVGGTALGGLSGRLFAGILTDLSDWRWAVGSLGAIGLLASLAFIYLLPSSKNFVKQQFSLLMVLQRFAVNLAIPSLHTIYLLAFLLMGCSVALFNYAGFYLTGQPFFLSSTAIGFLFMVYIFGVFSANFSGKLVVKFGFYKVFLFSFTMMLLGIVSCAVPNLIFITLGLSLFIAGFFAAHSLGSGLVGLLTNTAKAQASAMYLFAYYMGSSVLGYGLGEVWELFGWIAMLASIALLLLIAAWRSLVLVKNVHLPNS